MSHNHIISAETCNINEMQNNWQLCKCVHQVCMWCAYVMHVQCMINKFNHSNPQNLELIGVQNNTKMSFRHFIKHLVCTYKTNMWAMHEHEWNFPKYMLKLLKLANTNTHKSNGIEPNQEIEKNFAKTKVPNPFSKIPQFK